MAKPKPVSDRTRIKRLRDQVAGLTREMINAQVISANAFQNLREAREELAGERDESLRLGQRIDALTADLEATSKREQSWRERARSLSRETENVRVELALTDSLLSAALSLLPKGPAFGLDKWEGNAYIVRKGYVLPYKQAVRR